jgi:DNA repair exonuclease SbcCD ATPase subunit
MATHLTLTNWQCHEALEIVLRQPINLIVSSNMAGKTAIRDGIEFLIAGTGQLRGIATKKDLAFLSIRDGAKECTVELTVHGPDGEFEFQAVRSMNRTGAQTLTCGGKDGPREFGKLGDAQDYLWTLLKLTAEQLRGMLGAEALFVLHPNDRRKLVSSVLGELAIPELEIRTALENRGPREEDAVEFAKLVTTRGWRAAEEEAGRRRADAKGMAKAMGDPPAPVSHYRPPWREDLVNLSQIRAEDITTRLESYRQTVARQQQETAHDRGSLEERLRGLEGRQGELKRQLEELEQEPGNLSAAEEAERLARGRYEAAKNAQEEAAGKAAQLQVDVDWIEQGEPVKPDLCPVIVGRPKCPFTKPKLEAHLQKITAEQGQIRAQHTAALERLSDADEALGRMASAHSSTEREAARLRKIPDQIAGLDAELVGIDSEIEQASVQLADASDAKPADGSFLRTRIEQGEHMLDAKREFDRQTERAATYAETISGHEEDARRWDIIAQALKPDGIEGEFSDRFLSPMREALERFGKRFGGIRLDQEFNVELLWEGSWRRWQQLSESGRLRIGYAVQFAFAHLCRFPFLIIDQIDHLDGPGKRQLIETLRDVAPEFRSVLGLATLQRPKPSASPFEDVVSWHLDGGKLRRIN